MIQPKQIRYLVSIIGIDGSGKTTVSTKLRERFSRIGVTYNYLHPTFGSIVNISRIATRRPHNDSEQVTKTALFSSNTSIMITLAYTLIMLADSLVNYILFFRPLLKMGILVSDRYFYHYVLMHIDNHPTIVRCFANIIPKPSIIFLLDVSPKIAKFRNEEYTLDEYRAQVVRYEEFLRITGLGKRAIRINSERSAESVSEEIYNHMIKFFNIK